MTDLPYTTYAEYLARLFPGKKVQKISVNAGCTCPNRDGTIGTGGCIYCDNSSFSPEYCRTTQGIEEQLEAGKQFFRKKYREMQFLAYFQTYTNTHGSISKIMENFRRAAAVDGVCGIIIGTRPDCMPPSLLSELKHLNHSTKVIIEYGAESSHDTTLSTINRGHTWSQVVDAVQRTSQAGISCGLHLIAGLPGESNADIIDTIEAACALPIDTLKIHQLQILRDTKLARLVESGTLSVPQFTIDQYLDLCCEIVRRVPRRIAIERFVSQSPADMLISPKWGLKNYQFTNLLHARL